jgi:hypothetical protein
LFHLIKEHSKDRELLSFKPFRGVDENGISHWWLQNNIGDIIDPTSEQYTSIGKTPPYSMGKSATYMTADPSNRAKVVINKVNNNMGTELTDSDIKEMLEENFEYLTSMSVKEYTLFRTWVDLRKKYKEETKVEDDPFDDFFDEPEEEGMSVIQTVKSNIWVPESPDDYLNIEPRLIWATNNEYTEQWQILRDFGASNIWHQSPGRLFKFIVIDDVTGKYIGFLSMGSDFIAIGGRDEYIGWTNDDKLLPKEQGRLRNTCMGSTIVPTQPFGFNYNGGKLMALLTASAPVADKWYQQYGDILVGCTTTSLYGGASMYNRLANWRKCKSSKGEIAIEPSEDVWDVCREWFRKNYPELQPKTPPGKKILSHPKAKTLAAIYKHLKIKVPKNNAPRGVYWNELYKDTKEFLRHEKDKVEHRKYDNSVEALTDLWKERYAKKRVANLLENDRWTDDVLFYDDLLDLEWEEVVEKYIQN